MGEMMSFDRFSPESEAMQKVYREIEGSVKGGYRCIFLGPRGSGKEFLATYYYHCFCAKKGRGRTPPFNAINCACLVDTLAASQLFGYVRGAFTGAVSETEGLFQASKGGVLFLDEIGEAPFNIQMSLSRAMDPGEFTKVGSARKYSSKDVTVIAATERQKDELRSSIYERFTFIINVPGLDQREEDVPDALEYFLARTLLKRPDVRRRADLPEATDAYEDEFSEWRSNPELVSLVRDIGHDLEPLVPNRIWPGNFRALSNAVTNSVMMARGGGTDNLQKNVRTSFLDYRERFSSSKDSSQSRVSFSTENAAQELQIENEAYIDLQEKLQRVFPGMKKGEKTQLAQFLIVNDGRIFKRVDLEEQFPKMSTSTIHSRLKRLREAGLIVKEGSKGELYKVTLTSEDSSYMIPSSGMFLPLPLDVMWPNGVRQDLLSIRNLLDKSRVLFIGGERGAGKTVCVQALGMDLSSERSVFYYPIGDRGIPWFLEILDKELQARGITTKTVLRGQDSANPNEQAAALTGYINQLFQPDEHPLLILDNTELASDPAQEKALLAMIQYWKDLSFLLVGKKLSRAYQEIPDMPILEYTITYG